MRSTKVLQIVLHQAIPSSISVLTAMHGGQIGGPIFKNKLFFFANYEYNEVSTGFGSGSSVIGPNERRICRTACNSRNLCSERAGASEVRPSAESN